MAIPNEIIKNERVILIVCGAFNILLCLTALLFQVTHRQMIRKSGIFPFMVNMLLTIEGVILFFTGIDASFGGNNDEIISTRCKIASGVDQSIYVASILYINFYATFLSTIIKSVYIKAKKYIKLYHILVVVITTLYVLGFYMLPTFLAFIYQVDITKATNPYRTAGYDIAGLCRIENDKNINSAIFVLYTTLPFWVTLIWGIINVIKLYGFVPSMHKKQLKSLLHVYIVFYLSFIFINSINPLINFVVEIKCYGRQDYASCGSEIDQSPALKYVVVATSCLTGIVVALNILLQRYVYTRLFSCCFKQNEESELERFDKILKTNNPNGLDKPLTSTENITDEIVAFEKIAQNQCYFTLHTILMSICYIFEKVFDPEIEDRIEPEFDYVRELKLTKKQSGQLSYLTKYYMDNEMRANINIKVYAPDAFRKMLKQNDSRKSADFIDSLSPLANEELLNSTKFEFGSGKSDSLFFTTKDKKLIVKTAFPNEMETMKKNFLPHCFQHIYREGNDLPFIKYYMAATINVK